MSKNQKSIGVRTETYDLLQRQYFVWMAKRIYDKDRPKRPSFSQFIHEMAEKGV